jgi:hypothetical protein
MNKTPGLRDFLRGTWVAEQADAAPEGHPRPRKQLEDDTMKRAFLIVAVVAYFGAMGCGRRCDRETLTLNWTFLDGANAVQTCANSGTVAMQILLNGVAVADDLGNTRFSCADFPNSITFFDVPIGSSDVEFDAFDVNNQFIVQQHQTVNINSCGNTTATMGLAMIQAPLVIDYALSGVPCLNTDVIWYSLTTPDGVTFVVDDTRNTNFVVTCGSQINFSPALFGPYTLNAIEIVDNSNPTVPVPIATNCAPHTVDHLGFDSIPVTLGLPVTGFCF